MPQAVTLIRVSELVPGSSNALTTPPVGVAYLAAAVRAAGHPVRVIDGVGAAVHTYTPLETAPHFFLHGLTLESIVANVDPAFAQVIGVSCMFSQDWPVARRLLALLRDRFPDATIVAGGEHVSAMAAFVLDDCPAVDISVCGEGEATLCELLALRDAGTMDRLAGCAGIAFRGDAGVVVTPARKRVRELDELAWPAWDLVPIGEYLDNGCGFGVAKGRAMPIVATRGCPYACTFCSNVNMWTTRWFAREPAKVVDEIAHYVERYGADNIDFYDLTAIVKKQWILEFCAELERRGIDITFQLPSGTRSEAIDEEVAKALHAAGCCHMVYAPESGSERTLKNVQKQVAIPKMLASMRAAVAAGTFVKANIVIGFPDETLGDIARTFGFLARMAWVGVHDVFVYTFSPYPGSPLFDRLRAEGRIDKTDDAYFLSLASYVMLDDAVSYTEHVSSRALRVLRIAGLAWFYGLMFALRPQRIVRVITNLVRGRMDMRIEGFLQSLVLRNRSHMRGLVARRTVDAESPRT